MDGTTAAPVVKGLKLNIKGVTSVPDAKKGYVSSVIILLKRSDDIYAKVLAL